MKEKEINMNIKDELTKLKYEIDTINKERDANLLGIQDKIKVLKGKESRLYDEYNEKLSPLKTRRNVIEKEIEESELAEHYDRFLGLKLGSDTLITIINRSSHCKGEWSGLRSEIVWRSDKSDFDEYRELNLCDFGKNRYDFKSVYYGGSFDTIEGILEQYKGSLGDSGWHITSSIEEDDDEYDEFSFYIHISYEGREDDHYYEEGKGCVTVRVRVPKELK